MIASNMTPGQTYTGTADGPEALVGVTFTVLAMVSFDPENPSSVPSDNDDAGALIQVQYDAWGYPLPESATFAPGDWVINEGRS